MFELRDRTISEVPARVFAGEPVDLPGVKFQSHHHTACCHIRSPISPLHA